jgi:formylglycine-generating enzyme required for sulfatase activity
MAFRTAALAAALAAISCSGAPPAPAPAPGRDESGMIGEPGGQFWTRGRGTLEDTGAYVAVAPFFLDATEVTVAAYGACVRAGRCQPAGNAAQDVDLRGDGSPRADAACNGDRPDRADHPVNCVAWADARAYCAFIGKRLPTENEWEWAARNGGRAVVYPWGDAAPADRACWSGEGNGEAGPRAGTCQAAGHPAGDSAAGVKDLAGNVAEWTETGDVALTDSRGRGGVPVRIVRGGGFAETSPVPLRADARAKAVPTKRAPDLGFRCAKIP